MSIPTKTPIYGTLVGHISLRSPTFGGEVVEKMHEELQNTLKNQEFTKFKLLVRFACELVNASVLEIASLVELFDTLLEVTEEKSFPQSRSDYFISVVLNSLPWVNYLIF